MTGIIIKNEKINSYKDTVKKIFEMCKQYKTDLYDFTDYDFFSFYNYVRGLPFIADPENIEQISRPRYTLKKDWEGSRDCDDKCVIQGAWAELKNLEYRFACVGNGFFPHHIYIEYFFLENWLPADSTYSDRCILGGRLYDENFRKVFYFSDFFT